MDKRLQTPRWATVSSSASSQSIVIPTEAEAGFSLNSFDGRKQHQRHPVQAILACPDGEAAPRYADEFVTRLTLTGAGVPWR